MNYERQTYDLLQLLGDVGGLQAALFMIVRFLFTWYSKYTKGAFIMENLFKMSSEAFRKERNLMKPSTGGLQLNTSTNNPFVQTKKKSLFFSIQEDLQNRLPINQQSFISFLFGVLCRKQRQLRYLKLHRRSYKKVTNDLDILNIIRQ